MAWQAAAAAGLSLGASIYGTERNASEQRKQNARNDRRSEQEAAWDFKVSQHNYQQQKQDNIDFWNMTNAYNSPEQQMIRLKQAGLNPHLVYGKGADTTASVLSTQGADGSKANPSRGNAAQVDYNGLGSAISQYYDVQQGQLQTDNLHLQNQLLQKDLSMKDLNIAGKGISNASNQFQYNQAQKLADLTYENLRLRNEETSLNMYLNLQNNERENLKNASDLQVAAEQILHSRIMRAKTQQERENLKESLKAIQKDNSIRDFEIMLNKMGINKNDPTWQRWIGMFLNDPEGTMKKIAPNGLTKQSWDGGPK